MVHTPLRHYLSRHTLPLPATHGEIGNGFWTLTRACSLGCLPLAWCDLVSHDAQRGVAAASGRRKERSLMRRKQNLLSRSEVSRPMIPNGCIEIQTSPLDRASVPSRFAEVVMIAHHLASQGLLEAFTRARCVWCEGASAAMNPLIFSGC
jgi:hypothetical protein